MIIEKFTNLFKKKSERSMQERAEESRIKKDAEDAGNEFDEATKNLKVFLREIKSGDKQNNG